jgi:hypothetical protein
MARRDRLAGPNPVRFITAPGLTKRRRGPASLLRAGGGARLARSLSSGSGCTTCGDVALGGFRLAVGSGSGSDSLRRLQRRRRMDCTRLPATERLPTFQAIASLWGYRPLQEPRRAPAPPARKGSTAQRPGQQDETHCPLPMLARGMGATRVPNRGLLWRPRRAAARISFFHKWLQAEEKAEAASRPPNAAGPSRCSVATSERPIRAQTAFKILLVNHLGRCCRITTHVAERPHCRARPAVRIGRCWLRESRSRGPRRRRRGQTRTSFPGFPGVLVALGVLVVVFRGVAGRARAGSWRNCGLPFGRSRSSSGLPTVECVATCAGARAPSLIRPPPPQAAGLNGDLLPWCLGGPWCRGGLLRLGCRQRPRWAGVRG